MISAKDRRGAPGDAVRSGRLCRLVLDSAPTSARVCSCTGGVEQVCPTCLDHPAAGHHDHVVGHRPDGAEVVREQHDRQAGFRELGDLVENHTAVHRVLPGGRLVHDQAGRVGEQCVGDDQPLLLAARELMWIAAQERAIEWETCPLQRLGNGDRRARSMGAALDLA